MTSVFLTYKDCGLITYDTNDIDIPECVYGQNGRLTKSKHNFVRVEQ